MLDNRAVRSEVRPSDLAAAVRSEYVRIWTERRDDLVAVSFNAVLVTICWFLLPDSIRDWLFTLHGALAFAFVLEMWMLGDTPATNVVGRDAVRAMSQLHDPAALRLWLRAKHLALASLVGTFCALIALVIGIVEHRYMAGVATAIVLLFLPLGVLSIAAWIALWLPYHPQRLIWRWQHRSDWRAALLRWSALVVLPFLIVPLIALILLSPTLVIWILGARNSPPPHLPPADLWAGTAVAVVVSLIVFYWAPVVASEIARRRFDKLNGYLSDPEHG
jgi:hypothetical protein